MQGLEFQLLFIKFVTSFYHFTGHSYMRKIYLLGTLVLSILFNTISTAQDFSNKGKDFWVAYGYHQVMVAGNGQDMRLYFSAEQTANVTVTIPGIGYSQSYIVPANTTIASNIIPKGAPQDARLLAESTTGENKGIHIVSDKPIVAYAHIYNGSVSGATILFPTPTLGKEYYSVNYRNISNTGAANSWFYVLAADTGTTTVRITPSAATINHAAGVPFDITLTQGQVYQLMGQAISGSNPNEWYDLTGSKIQSISTNGNACKRIAVFSGSGRISITCNGTSSSSDNYMVQAFPKNAWGRRFLTVPSVDYNTPNATTLSNSAANLYRICVSDPTTVVTINGTVTTLPLINNFYYDLPASTSGNNTTGFNLIESDKPVVVAQYFPSRGACGMANPGNNGDGDPEVIYLSPVEQNINKVLWNANAQANINQNKHFINILIPNSGTAISSFRLDNFPVAPSDFIVHPRSPSYSYARINVGSTPGGGANIGLPHVVSSDSGFNAVAYGYGAAESYGYNAGTNIRDLAQQLELTTQYGIETSPSVCINSPFRFKIYFPDSTNAAIPTAIRFDSLKWEITNPSIIVPNNFPIVQINPTIDSTNIRNGRKVNWYSIPGFYTFNTPGLDTLILTAFTSTNEGCGSDQVYEFPIEISGPPVAGFTFTPGGCVTETFQFNETTPQTPKPTYKFWWDFGDPASGANNISLVRNPTHLFSAPGPYLVRFANVTTPGCLSDTTEQTIVVPELPTATITGNATVCINDNPEPQITFTASGGTAPYTFSYHINAGPAIHVNSPTPTLTINAPTGTAGTFTYHLDSIKNTGSSLCVTTYTNTSVDVVVNANTGLALDAGSNNAQTVCENVAIATIKYNITGGGNNATVTGLPAGVTGTYSAGVLTIAGTPTLPGSVPVTYTYTVTATGLCLPNSVTGSITVNPDAEISAPIGNPSPTLCINTPLPQIQYNITGGGTGGNVTFTPVLPGVTGTYSGGVFTIAGTPTLAGTFNYVVNTTGSCVQTSASGTIIVTPDATFNLVSPPATTNQTVCLNHAITNIEYQWGQSATGFLAVSGALPTGVTATHVGGGLVRISGTPTSAGVFTYTLRSDGPCQNPQRTVTITVTDESKVTLSSAAATRNQELCFNASLTRIDYSPVGSTSNITVSGLPTGLTGVVVGGVLQITGNPTQAGTFNYVVTPVGPCYEGTPDGGTIIVNPLPTPNFSVTTPSCETRVLTFTDLSSPNVGALNGWAWNFGDASPIDNTQNPTHSYTAAGNYTVSLTVTNDEGCVSAPVLTRNITINDRPKAGFMVPEVCINDVAAVFTDTSSIASGSLSPAGYEWNFGDPGSGALNTSTTLNGTHLYTAVGSYTVTHIVTSTLGCKDTITHNIFINGADPAADFSVANPATLCSNDSTAITNLSTISAGSITKIEIIWDFLGAPGVVETDDFPAPNKVYKHKYPTFQSPLTRTYTIRFRAYSGTLCQDVETKTITLNATPRVQFNSMPDICLDAAPYQIPPSIASEIGGVPGTGVFTGPGVSSSGVFTPASVGPGTYLIKYTFTSSAAGCVDTLSNTITVLDSASARFTYSTLNCENSPVSFNSTTSTIPPASGTITGWTWDFGDPASGANNISTQQNPTHLFSGWGTYNVTLFVTTSNGCRSTVRTTPVFVNPVPRPDFTFPASACLPSATVAFNSAPSTIPDGTQSSFTYLWDFGDPASGALNTSTGSSPSHIYNSVGPFTVTLQITSGAGCVNTKSILVNTIHPQPTGDFTTNKPDVCVGEAITFTDASNPADGTTTQWSWTMDDGNTRASSTFNYTYALAGTYDVSLFILNSFGCRSTTATKQVTVNPYPVVNAGPDLFILQDGSDTIQPIITNDINPTYLWTPNNYFISSNTVRNPIVKGVEDITYTLIVTGRGGCASQDQVFIKVLKGPEIPNIFSPNGDGIHDRWVIKYLDTYPESTVDIYNRYGQLIFHSIGYGTPWDGTIDGKPVPLGTYYYIVNPKNGRKTMSGYVDVIR
jgi:gliding motility-associated-like protein